MLFLLSIMRYLYFFVAYPTALTFSIRKISCQIFTSKISSSTVKIMSMVQIIISANPISYEIQKKNLNVKTLKNVCFLVFFKLQVLSFEFKKNYGCKSYERRHQYCVPSVGCFMHFWIAFIYVSLWTHGWELVIKMWQQTNLEAYFIVINYVLYKSNIKIIGLIIGHRNINHRRVNHIFLPSSIKE